MREGVNYLAAAGPRPFIYGGDAYSGLVFVCLALVATPLLCDRWLGRYCDQVAVRIGFVIAVIGLGLFGLT